MNRLTLSFIATTLTPFIMPFGHAMAQETSAAAAVIEPAAEAQSQPQLTIDAPDTYRFTFVAGAWVPRVLGDVGLGFDPGEFDLTLEESFDLDNSETVFTAEITMLKNDVWKVDFSGFDFSTETSGVITQPAIFGDLVLNPGDAFNASVDLTSAVVEVGYWGYDACRMRHGEPGHECRVDLRLGPYVAMRYLDLDQGLEIPGEGAVDVGGEWVGVMFGGNLHMRYRLAESFPVIDYLGIDGSMAFGPAFGGDGGTMAQVRASLTAYINDNVGLSFGYRLIHAIVENDDYEFNGGLQGLFFGATLEF